MAETAFRPNPAGTVLEEGRDRWAPFSAESVQFVGDSNVLQQLFVKNEVELVASGFRWTEGPTWVETQRALLFSDTIDARIYKWTEADGSVAPLVEVSGGYDGKNVEDYDKRFEPGSNGMALAGDDLYICQHPTHRIAKMKISEICPGMRFSDSKFEVLADSVTPGGAPLNSPNDVIVGPDGAIWFTDPIYGFLEKDPSNPFIPVQPTEAPSDGNHNPSDLPYLDERSKKGVAMTGVYRWKDGALMLVVADLDRPNGLAFHGKTLWVANSSADEPSWTAYDAAAVLEGAAAPELPLKQTLRLSTAELGPMPGPGLSDGFKIDKLGRIWSSFPNGLVVIDLKERKVLAKVLFNINVSNVEFGAGADVWITGLGHLWRLQRVI